MKNKTSNDESFKVVLYKHWLDYEIEERDDVIQWIIDLPGKKKVKHKPKYKKD